MSTPSPRSPSDIPGGLHAWSVQDLKRALTQPQGMHPVIALQELRRRQAPGLLATARRQLANADDATLRASCALLLGAHKSAANRAALQAALGDPAPEVVRRAAEALGRIGEADDLAALRSLRTRKPVVRRSIDAAKALLSYTLGEARGLLSAPAAETLLTLGRAQASAVRVSTIATERLDSAFNTGLPAMKAAAHGSLIDCGRWRYLLVFNRKVFTRNAALLTDKPCLLGALLRSEKATGRFVLYASVLSRPAEQGQALLISVLRPGGLVQYAGELSVTDWHFSMRALNSRHVLPLAFNGTLDVSKQTLTMSRADVGLRKSVKQPPTRRPRPVLTVID
jgi:hypothetical protein